MLKILIAIVFFLTTASSFPRAFDIHDIHISLTELRFNDASSSFEVSIKIFIDDLEKAIAREGASGLHIGTPIESDVADEHIISYLDKYFSIEIDGVKLAPVFIGKEVTEDLLAVWCYVEYSKQISSPQTCTLSNSILLDVYSDQRNIMDIHMSKTHKAYEILSPGRTTWSYTF